jgi:hypothetical protein
MPLTRGAQRRLAFKAVEAMPPKAGFHTEKIAQVAHTAIRHRAQSALSEGLVRGERGLKMGNTSLGLVLQAVIALRFRL